MPEKSLTDILWVLLASGLVFLMQPGFAMLESGFTRSKNSINVAMKNMSDLGFSILLFWAFGFALMFGASYKGWIGTDSFLLDTSGDMWHTSFFLFQAMFCATAATIVSGAAAERMRFGSYLIITLVVSGLIYPLFGHWVWSEDGWLGNEGFVDFAGSTVVHSVGGWVGLAAVIQLGARGGRFGEDGTTRDIAGSNIPNAILGSLLLWFGWFGFNGGSTLAMDQSVARIITNTVLAGASGGVTALLVGWPIKRVAEVTFIINGSLAGLVGITASCHAVTAPYAVLIGAIGGLVMFAVEELLERLRVDDAVGAFPVHAASGIWGTLAVALFGDPEILGTGLNMWEQLGAQALGIGTCAVWAFGIGYIVLWTINKIIPLRVSAEDEKIGLNVAEHGATTELIDLFQAMDAQAQSGDLSIRVPVEPFTEVGQIASRYNTVMSSLEATLKERDAIFANVDEGLFLMDPKMVIGAQYSTALERIFQRESLALENFGTMIGRLVTPEEQQAIQDYLELMLKPDMDVAWVRDLNPMQEFEIHFDDTVRGATTKILQCKFSRIYDGKAITHLMGAVKDVTEQVMLTRKLRANEEKNKQQMERLFSVLHVEPATLAEFIEDSNTEVKNINNVLRADDPSLTLSDKLDAIYRAMHTIKGNASLLELNFVADQAHEFEERLSEMKANPELGRTDFLPLVFMMSRMQELLDELGGLSRRLTDYSASTAQDGRDAGGFREAFLKSLAGVVEKLSTELGKECKLDHAAFQAEAIPQKFRKPLKDILVQLVRNSLSHGIETPDERLGAAKAACGTIQLAATILEENDQRRLSLIIRDDGRGLAIEKLRRLALESGRWSADEINGWSEAQIARLIYMPGLSTADESDKLAGRGVGMDIIKKGIQDLGGKIRTSFAPGRFTEFSILLPL